MGLSAPKPAPLRVFHVVGQTQWEGSCRFHLFNDCGHLKRPRTMGPMNMTGVITETTIAPDDRRICRHCIARRDRAKAD